MSMLDDHIRQEVTRFLEGLAGPVRLVLFTRESDCELCPETRQLVEEVAALSDQLTVESFDFVTDAQKAAGMGIDKVPALAIIGAQDYGVRFYGIPSGYEFTSLLYTIRAVASGQPELSEAGLQALAGVNRPVHLQVFVTPTCPYCPGAVRLAHALAFASERVTADMVMANEFPQLSQRYAVMAVPKTVVTVGETVRSFEGAVPEPLFVAQVLAAAGGAPPKG